MEPIILGYEARGLRPGVDVAVALDVAERDLLSKGHHNQVALGDGRCALRVL